MLLAHWSADHSGYLSVGRWNFMKEKKKKISCHSHQCFAENMNFLVGKCGYGMLGMYVAFSVCERGRCAENIIVANHHHVGCHSSSST